LITPSFRSETLADVYRSLCVDDTTSLHLRGDLLNLFDAGLLAPEDGGGSLHDVVLLGLVDLLLGGDFQDSREELTVLDDGIADHLGHVLRNEHYAHVFAV